MTTLVAGSTALADRLALALAHGDPDGYVRMSEPDAGLAPVEGAADRGADRMRAFLRKRSVHAVLDANDPFVEGASALLELVCNDLGVPHLRVALPSFEGLPDAGRWSWVDSLVEAAEAAWRGGRVPVVALEPLELCSRLVEDGRRDAVCHRLYTVADGPRPAWLREPDRPVRTASHASRLIQDESVTVLLANDSGDPRVLRLLELRTAHALDVVMVRRSPRWRGVGASSAVVHDVGEALTWRNAVL